MKDKNKTKAELIKELKFLREEREKVILKDIAERKQAEQTIKESEEKYRTVFESTAPATVIVEEDTTISMANTQFEKLSGYSKDEIENKKKWTKFVVKEDLERMKKYHIARRKAGENAPTEYEFRFIDKKGNMRDIFLKIGMIPNTKKSIASLMDITKRKQAEERVKHLNLVLRAIRSVNQLIVKVKDRESLLKGVCNNLIKTRGYYNAWIALLDESGKLETYAEAGIGKAILPMVETLKKGELTVCGNKALKQQKVVITKDPASTCTECPLAQEYSGRGAMTIRLEYNGKIYGLMTVSTPAHLADDQEEQSLFKEVAGDIAFSIHNIELDEERIQAEENVKTAKDELQITLDSVSAMICYKDIKGRIVRANKALADSLKVPIKDIVGKTTEELFPKEQAEKMRKDDKEVMISGKPKMNITEPYDTPEGTRWAITDKMPYKDKKGKVISLISLSKDITKQRQIEEKLQNYLKEMKKDRKNLKKLSKKLIKAQEEERRKISEIIHDDIGQNITAIKINMSLFEEAINTNTVSKVKERLTETKSLLNHIFDKLYEFGLDLRSPLLRELGLVPALRAYVDRYKKREKINIDFKVINLKKRLNKEIEIVIFRIVQEALTNISKHACASKIYLRLENKKSKVCVLIKDNGKGFNIKNISDFEELSKGLGLIEMRERIEIVGGSLEIKSSLGEGTQLLIEIPCYPLQGNLFSFGK